MNKFQSYVILLNGYKIINKLFFLITLCLALLSQLNGFSTTINIISYGANGSDGNDDAVAIQNAIDASSAGDTIYIPNGTYLIGTPVHPKSGIIIAGQSKEGVILRFIGVTYSSVLKFHGSSSFTNVELTNFTIDGNNSSNCKSGISASGGGGHNIHDLIIKDIGTDLNEFGPMGMYLSNMSNCIVKNNIIENIGINDKWGSGMRISSAHHIQVINNTISNTGRGGIHFDSGSKSGIIRGNIISGSGKYVEALGIEIHNHCDSFIIEDNDVDHWISVANSTNTAVRNNKIHASDGVYAFCGLELIGQNTVITDNTVIGGHKLGISISGPVNDYQYIGYNLIDSVIQWGIQMQGTSESPIAHHYFYKNKFSHTDYNNPNATYPTSSGRGFRINGNTINTVLDANEITGNKKLGIEIGGAGVDQLSFINNIITGNGSSSINQYPDAATKLEWENNTVSGNEIDTQLTTRGFSNAKPNANFSAPSVASIGETITFINQSTDPDGTIFQYLWDFGEGIPSNDINPSYAYQDTGTYLVTLVVWDDGGRASISQSTIKVNSSSFPTMVHLTEEANFGYKVYPNPTNGTFNLDFSNNYIGAVDVSLVNLKGEKIQKFRYFKNSQVFNHTISLTSDIKSGYYFIEIIEQNYRSVKLFIIR